MKIFETRHRVQHRPTDMYALVADIERYPEFVPLCEDLRVRRRETDDVSETLVADMTVAFKLFRETFTSRVVLFPEKKLIHVSYLDGPFRKMENRWAFLTPETDGSATCDVEFYLAYELKSRTLQMVVGGVFDRAFGKFAEAFERRADQIHGTDALPQQRPGFAGSTA